MHTCAIHCVSFMSTLIAVATNGVVIAAEKKHKSVLYDEKTITKVLTIVFLAVCTFACALSLCVFCMRVHTGSLCALVV